MHDLIPHLLLWLGVAGPQPKVVEYRELVPACKVRRKDIARFGGVLVFRLTQISPTAPMSATTHKELLQAFSKKIETVVAKPSPPFGVPGDVGCSVAVSSSSQILEHRFLCLASVRRRRTFLSMRQHLDSNKQRQRSRAAVTGLVWSAGLRACDGR